MRARCSAALRAARLHEGPAHARTRLIPPRWCYPAQMLLMTRGVEVMSLDFPDAKVLVVRPLALCRNRRACSMRLHVDLQALTAHAAALAVAYDRKSLSSCTRTCGRRTRAWR